MTGDSTKALFPLICCVMGMLLAMLPFLALAIRIVPKNKQLSIYRLGRHIGERGPGLVLLIPIIDRGVSIDSPIGTTGDEQTE